MRLEQYFFRFVTVVSLILLASFGGAIFAAPVTIPLLAYSTVRNVLSGWWSIVTKLTLALTIAQGTWAIVYFTLGESIPAIWLVPGIVLLVVAVGLLIHAKPQRRP